MNADDRVKCINNEDTDFKLTMGRIYTIESVDHYTGYVFLKEVQGAWSMSRFALVSAGNFSLDDTD